MTSTYERKQDEVVAFHTPFEGSGKIVGCSVSEQPVLGKGWIVEVLDYGKTAPSHEEYPFTHIVVFENWIYNALSLLYNTRLGKDILGA